MFPDHVKIPEKFEVKPARLEASKTALIIVDMQNAFAHEKGRLFVPESRKTIEPIKKLLEKARSKNVLLVYTQDWHQKDDPEFNIWGEHAVAGTWEAEIVDELKPSDRDVLVKKLRYDGFYGTYLDDVLRMKKIEKTVIAGTVANICVLHTAGSAAIRGYEVFIPIDCISALYEFDYMSTLRQATFLYRAILTTHDKIDFI
ncbi:MAG: isochorismatase family cysteine hydrolase [Thermoproteota archaeon]